MKTAERQRALDLRARGWSVKEIEQALGVARSSVSRWVRDVDPDDAQRRTLSGRSRARALAAAQRKAAAARAVRHGYQETGRRLARERDASYRGGFLPYGTCTVVVDDTQLVQTIFGSIQEDGGFDRPAWLD